MISQWQTQKKIIKHLHINIIIDNITFMSNISKRFSDTQCKRCKLFDKHYGSREKLEDFQSHQACMRNQYNHCSNRDGFVNFGTSFNQVIAKTTIKYLPLFMKLQDCFSSYLTRGCDQFNKKVCEGSKFWWDETFTFNSNYCILSLFCSKYKNVFIIGKCDKINLETILDYSQSKRVANEQTADLVILFRYQKEMIQQIEQKSPNSVKLFILLSKEHVYEFDPNKNNYAFAYKFFFKEGLRLTILQTKDTKIKKNISDSLNFFSISTVVKRASLVSDLKIDIEQAGVGTLCKMIEKDSKAIVPKQNIWFTLGATSGMDTIFRVLFKNMTLGVDYPYPDSFKNIFTSHAILNSILPNSNLIDRVKQSQSKGFAGYIISNPRNQDGTILKPEEVDQICEYVRNKQCFHLVFDENFLNTQCFGKETKSAASFAVQLPNIHVVRGLEKDFGLGGLKVGFVISSNPIVMKKFEEWKPIISHHPYTISVVNSMLRKSNYGTEIIETGKQILRDYFEIVCSELDKQNISYKIPESGCYLLVNLKEFMREQTLDEQNILWKKLFYKYRVNLSNVATNNATEFGYFRICPILNQQTMREGLKRMIIALKDKQEQ